MMYLLNIDANLMSMGAIDFGIIIDGAVIIVEFVAFKINKNFLKLIRFLLEKNNSLKMRLRKEAPRK